MRAPRSIKKHAGEHSHSSYLPTTSCPRVLFIKSILLELLCVCIIVGASKSPASRQQLFVAPGVVRAFKVVVPGPCLPPLRPCHPLAVWCCPGTAMSFDQERVALAPWHSPKLTACVRHRLAVFDRSPTAERYTHGSFMFVYACKDLPEATELTILYDNESSDKLGGCVTVLHLPCFCKSFGLSAQCPTPTCHTHLHMHAESCKPISREGNAVGYMLLGYSCRPLGNWYRTRPRWQLGQTCMQGRRRVCVALCVVFDAVVFMQMCVFSSMAFANSFWPSA